MELNERETLVKIEQQINNFIDNQNKISEELREFLKKLEKNDKALGVLRTDVKSHLSETPLRREDVNNKLNYITKEIEQLETECKRSINIIERNKELHDKNMDDLNSNIGSEKKEREDFQLIVTTSIKNFKFFISIIVGLLAFVLAVFQVLPYLIKVFN